MFCTIGMVYFMEYVHTHHSGIIGEIVIISLVMWFSLGAVYEYQKYKKENPKP